MERAAGEGVTIARAGFLPTVDLRFANGWARTNNTHTRTRATRSLGDSQSVVLFRIESSLTISQMLFDGFATANRTDAGRARVACAGFQVVGTADGIALRAAAGYMNVLQARRLVAIAERYVAVHEEVVEGIGTLVAEGAATEAELEQADGRLALAEATLTQFRGTLRDADAAFREATGDWPVDVVMPLVEPGGLPPQAEDAVAEATQSHPGLLAAANIRSLQLDLRAAGAAFLPRVSLDLAGSRNDNAGGVEVPTADFTALFTLTYNFYRGGADRAAIEASKALLSEARLRQEETRRLIEQNDLGRLQRVRSCQHPNPPTRKRLRRRRGGAGGLDQPIRPRRGHPPRPPRYRGPVVRGRDRSGQRRDRRHAGALPDPRVDGAPAERFLTFARPAPSPPASPPYPRACDRSPEPRLRSRAP